MPPFSDHPYKERAHARRADSPPKTSPQATGILHNVELQDPTSRMGAGISLANTYLTPAGQSADTTSRLLHSRVNSQRRCSGFRAETALQLPGILSPNNSFGSRYGQARLSWACTGTSQRSMGFQASIGLFDFSHHRCGMGCVGEQGLVSLIRQQWGLSNGYRAGDL